MSDSSSDILEIEVNSKALDYLKEKGDVFVLTDVQNPRYSYYKVKNYEGNLAVKFEEFVEICKTYTGTPSDTKIEFTVRVYTAKSPLDALPSNLALFVNRTGYPKVDEWLKTLNEEEIPDCQDGKKTFYLYHITTAP